MNTNELANELEKWGAPFKPYIDMLRQQEKEIKDLRQIVEGTIKQAFYEDDYHKLKAEYDLLKAHPMRELTDEEIYAEMIKCIDSSEDGHTFKYKNFARAILKKASEK